ncbi:MAG: dual specificity protein phosphatase family protein [Chloroflexota bacterium]
MIESIHLFDWLLADRLAACVNPLIAPQVIEILREQRIGRVVNLHEQADPPELLQAVRADTVHLPVADFTPPSHEQLRAGVAAIRESLAAGNRVAVHCGAGLGRTGTLLATYLVSEGVNAEAAISQVRQARPGSIETPAQEAAVRQFAATITTSPSGNQ